MMYALVYQNGIANVFRCHRDGGRVRLIQHAYMLCEYFCLGLREAGYEIEVFHCDQTGDVEKLPWQRGPGELFASGKNPPISLEL